MVLYYNDSIILNELGQWQFRFYANDTVDNINSSLAQDQLSNNYIEVVDTIRPNVTNLMPQQGFGFNVSEDIGIGKVDVTRVFSV